MKTLEGEMADLLYSEWAEKIADSVRGTHTEHATAISIIAAQLAKAYCQGHEAGCRSTNSIWRSHLLRPFQSDPNAGVQKDSDEEREHGWSLGEAAE